MNHWATPVHYNGHLYGMYGQSLLTLKCLELATGAEKWSANGFGYGSVLMVSGKLLALSESGDVVLIEPIPAAFTEIARYRALDGSRSSMAGLPVKCWNAPAISNGRLYVRSTTEAVCLDVAAVAPALPLKLNPELVASADRFQLVIGNEDGSPLGPGRAANLDIFASTNLGIGFSGWMRLSNLPVLTNGQLRLTDTQSAVIPQRFFRVQERP